jgi:16S rRNA (cytidine1402-2'-O)-methyltransferase
VRKPTDTLGESAGSGRLVLLGAPLGNPADVSPRVAEVMAEADVLATEDTRRARRLARELGVTIGGRLVSCYDAVERERAEQVGRDLAGGATVALVTDGGMPAVSDPGYRVVQAALAAGAEVTTVPGPSAATAALAVSGLPCDRWCFEGFLSRKPGKRRTRLASWPEMPVRRSSSARRTGSPRRSPTSPTSSAPSGPRRRAGS